jgi:hypothetical protein
MPCHHPDRGPKSDDLKGDRFFGRDLPLEGCRNEPQGRLVRAASRLIS